MTATARKSSLAKVFRPNSLRARLTLSYAALTALLLTLLFWAIIALCAQRYIRATMLTIESVASQTRTLVASHWSEPDAQLRILIANQPHPALVHVMSHVRRPPGFPPPPGLASPGLAPPGLASPGLAPPPGNPGQRQGPFGPPHDRSLGAIFHLQARVIWLHQGEVFIAPTLPIENLLWLTLGAAIGAALVAAIISLAIGSWVARQAMKPLVTVTGELRRFASGDFQASVLDTVDRSELGDLVAAFNGAAAQVVAAFSERERTEQHLRMFLGEAGHEMRTPLTVMSAYLEMRDAGPGVDVTLPATELAILREQTRRLRALVERVMALARLEGSGQSQPELLDVAAVVQDAIAEATALQGGEVRLLNAGDDLVVVAEPWELHEAVGNLVDNALRYGGGSAVDVSLEVIDDRVVVRVADRGPGISEADSANLFRHFFRGEQAVGKTGSGLGLAIVARAAARLHGDITLERSDPGRTIFRLSMPTYQRSERSALI